MRILIYKGFISHPYIADETLYLLTVNLSPSQIIQKNLVRWIAYCSSIERWRVLQYFLREELSPFYYIRGCKQGCDCRYYLTATQYQEVKNQENQGDTLYGKENFSLTWIVFCRAQILSSKQSWNRL